MKKAALQSFKLLLADRQALVLCGAILLAGVAYVLYVAFSLSPTEQQIATRYTAFGDSQYYRHKWFYLLNFVAFGITVTGAHVALIAKLRARNVRPLALAFGWLTLILLAILFVITHSVLGIAYLS